MKFFAYCGFPNIFIHLLSPNSWVDDGQALTKTPPNTSSLATKRLFVFFPVSLSLDLINVKDSHNFYVGVSKPWLFVAIQLYWNFKLYCFYFFPNSALPNRGCGLSTDAAYTWTFTVYSLVKVHHWWSLMIIDDHWTMIVLFLFKHSLLTCMETL